MSKLCQRGQRSAAGAIQSQADIMIAMAPSVRTFDPDGIHDMRVASRRLCTALDLYRPFLPKGPRKDLRKRVRRVAHLLGTRRELDVMGHMLREHRDETRDLWQRFMNHAIAVIDARREGQQESCTMAAEIAEDPELANLVHTVCEEANGKGQCSRKLARKRLSEHYESARLAHKSWKSAKDPEALHQVRIQLKHLRYACEFQQELYGEEMTQFTSQVKSLQDILGDWNECRQLEEMVLTIGNAADYTLAQGAPLVAEAYGNRAGELAEQYASACKTVLGASARKTFHKLADRQSVKCCPK